MMDNAQGLAPLTQHGPGQPAKVAGQTALTPLGVQPATFGQPQTGGATPGQASPFAVQGAQMQAFGPGNDLRGTAIMPGQSGALNTYDQYVQGQAANVAGQSFSPWQAMGPVNYGTETEMLNGANGQMQGLGYDFGGANSAYGNAVNAQTSARNSAGQMLQGLGGSATSFGGGGGASANTSRFNSELDAALQGLQGPDRGELAAQTLGLLEERTQPGFESALRQTGQKAAALGRLGSGMTTNDLTGVTQDRERMLDQSRRQLATESAGQTLNDRLNVSNMQRGIAGDRFGGETFNAQMADAGQARQQQGAMFGANLQRGVANDLYGMGQDSANLQMGLGDRFGQQNRDMVGLGERQAGFQQGIANDLGNFTRDTYQSGVNERNAQRDDEFARAGYGLQSLGALAGVQNQQRGYESGLRDEARGERGYQGDMERQAFERQVQGQQFNEWLRNSGWNRAQQAGGMGFGNDPSGALGQAGQQAGQQAGDMYGVLGQLGMAYGNRGR